MIAALPCLLVCFVAEPPAGNHERCWYTSGEAAVLEWNPQSTPLESAAQGPGYLQVGYRRGDAFVLVAGGSYRWRSFSEFPSPRVYVALDDEVVFEPPPDRAADAVFARGPIAPQ